MQSENSKTTILSQLALGQLLASRSEDPKTEQISAIIDEAIVKKNAAQPRRAYIGASSLGEQCSRKIQYRYLNIPIDEDKGFSARTLRIFSLGHVIEDEMAKYIRMAGFDLRTEDKDGKQFGFSVANGEIAGHIDGVICGGPAAISYPCLWESKSANSKKFGEFVRVGVAKANPTYAAQIAIYQAYMDLTENPALFTVFNKDSSEIYYELVPFDAELAQRVSDKAVNILTASKANDMLPRVAQNQDFYLCKMCEFQQTCWKD